MFRLLLPLLLLMASPAAAQSRDAEVGLSGLEVPRFVSIGAREANMRSGPGERYPIIWTYRRAGLPVEVLREYGIWRQVRDPEGTVGWMNGNLLSGERTIYVTRTVRTLFARADLASQPVWRIEPGVVAKVVLCEEAWCRITIDGKSGYILRNQIWGVYPTEQLR